MIDINDTPVLVVDIDIAERNCRYMAASLKEHNISWRPHIKTHKSSYFAKKQLEWGAKGITCSSVGEAAVMAGAGIEDIFIAYPIVGMSKVQRYHTLHNHISSLSCLVNDLGAAKLMSDVFSASGEKANVLIEIDGRMGRGGVSEKDFPLFVESLLEMNGLNVIGASCFCGNAGKLPGEKERRNDALIEAENLLKAKDQLVKLGIADPITSGGSSVSSRYPDCLAGITEARAGTCIFNDMMHVSMGTCSLEDCAVHIRSTVISLPYEGRVVMDAGSKTLSTDTCRHRGFGYIKEFGDIAEIESLNEEHAMCNAQSSVSVGDILSIIPNHVCTSINLQNIIVGYKAGQYFEIPIEARGISK